MGDRILDESNVIRQLGGACGVWWRLSFFAVLQAADQLQVRAATEHWAIPRGVSFVTPTSLRTVLWVSKNEEEQHKGRAIWPARDKPSCLIRSDSLHDCRGSKRVGRTWGHNPQI